MRADIPIESVPPASARKLLLGKVPRKDVKPAVRGALTRMGMPVEWAADEADAFVVANFVMAGLGGYALAVPSEAAA